MTDEPLDKYVKLAEAVRRFLSHDQKDFPYERLRPDDGRGYFSWEVSQARRLALEAAYEEFIVK